MNKKYCVKKRRYYYKKRLEEKPLINIYESMLARCYNKNHTNYRYYGGKGISVCPRWRECYENFEDDMGDRPSKKHTLDRVNPSDGYYPNNCRWADSVTQATNKNPFGEIKERYISIKRDKRYKSERFRVVYKKHDRVFKTIDEAIEFRDSLIKSIT